MNKATATRTVNPLRFEDLEPHCFEDMVRQLVYNWRSWASLEATGRSGSDEGIDIRATENIALSPYLSLSAIADESDENDDDLASGVEEVAEQRVWIIQCKRERQIGPRDIMRIVQNDLSQQDTLPYGYIIAAACDFSKKTRDAFRQSVVAFGIEEFYLWGKAELEDMLFQPANDSLLFAYFGISLQVRRRSVKSAVRANLVLKRQLTKVLKAEHQRSGIIILIRDPSNGDCPLISEEHTAEFFKNPRWRYWEFWDVHPRNYVRFIVYKHLALVNWETQEWDAFFERDYAWPNHPQLFGLPGNIKETVYPQECDRARRWREHMPKENCAEFIETAAVSFERIIAIDDMGDSVNQAPHLLVEYRADGNPFEDHVWYSVRPEREGRRYNSHQGFSPDETKRISFFVGEPPPTNEEEVGKNFQAPFQK